MARQVAAPGGTVMLADIQGDKVEAVAADLGDAVEAYVGSVTDPGFVQQLVKDAATGRAPSTGLSAMPGSCAPP